jgi:N-terminal domain with HPIH motif
LLILRLQKISLVTLVFPESAPGSYKAAPQPPSVTVPSNSSAQSLPASSSRLSPISSYDLTLAFSLPSSEAPSFLVQMQELPVSDKDAETRHLEDESVEQKKWIMKAVRSPGSLGVRNWIRETLSDFLDLLKVGQALWMYKR